MSGVPRRSARWCALYWRLEADPGDGREAARSWGIGFERSRLTGELLTRYQK